MEYRTELSLEENLNYWRDSISGSEECHNKNEISIFIKKQLENLEKINLRDDEKFIIIQERSFERFLIPKNKQTIKQSKSNWISFKPYVLGILVFAIIGNIFETLSYAFQRSISPPQDFLLTEFDQTNLLSNYTIVSLAIFFLSLGLGLYLRNHLQNSLMAKLFNYPFLLFTAITTFIIQRFLLQEIFPPIAQGELNFIFISYVQFNLRIIEVSMIISVLLMILWTSIISKKSNRLKVAK